MIKHLKARYSAACEVPKVGKSVIGFVCGSLIVGLLEVEDPPAQCVKEVQVVLHCFPPLFKGLRNRHFAKQWVDRGHPSRRPEEEIGDPLKDHLAGLFPDCKRLNPHVVQRDVAAKVNS